MNSIIVKTATLISFFCAVVTTGFLINHWMNKDHKQILLGTHVSHIVENIQVIKGNEFDVSTLCCKKRFLVTLNKVSNVPSDTKEAVVRYLNESKKKNVSVQMVVRGIDGDKLVVDIYADPNDKNLSLSDWLKSKNLAYDKN